MSIHKKLIVVLGPTASGKTSLAIKLAQKFNGEVVSADSRQIYKGMDIGTAKPSKAEQKQARHYLIDEVKPSDEWNVSIFLQNCQKLIYQINKNSILKVN